MTMNDLERIRAVVREENLINRLEPMTVAEAAAYMKVGRGRIYHAIASGRLKAYVLPDMAGNGHVRGRKNIRLNKADVDDFVFDTPYVSNNAGTAETSARKAKDIARPFIKARRNP